MNWRAPDERHGPGAVKGMPTVGHVDVRPILPGTKEAGQADQALHFGQQTQWQGHHTSAYMHQHPVGRGPPRE